MHEGYPRKLINSVTGVALGCSLLAACGASPPEREPIKREVIDCLQNPGESVSVTVDSTKVGDSATLIAEGEEIYEVSVFKSTRSNGEPAPNQISVSPESGPLGVGGTEEEIDAKGEQGYVAIKRKPVPGIGPPYYKLMTVGDADSHNITFTIACDQDQTAR